MTYRGGESAIDGNTGDVWDPPPEQPSYDSCGEEEKKNEHFMGNANSVRFRNNKDLLAPGQTSSTVS